MILENVENTTEMNWRLGWCLVGVYIGVYWRLLAYSDRGVKVYNVENDVTFPKFWDNQLDNNSQFVGSVTKMQKTI